LDELKNTNHNPPVPPTITPNSPKAFHLLAKPTGAVCNLDCKYCFFLSKEMLYPGSRFRMADDLLETYIRQLLEAHQQVPEVTIAWQGGEPTLMGLDFFKLFFNHINRPMRLMADLLRRGRYADEVMNLLAMEEMQKIKQAMAMAKPNDPCPCGSGKKYRHCHGGVKTG
jgi:uncharacterized radical SAM superfamily Fe-S cluster-containing enzyme